MQHFRNYKYAKFLRKHSRIWIFTINIYDDILEIVDPFLKNFKTLFYLSIRNVPKCL
jgi:hypothetical protein